MEKQTVKRIIRKLPHARAVEGRGRAEGVQPFMYGGLGQRSRICVIADDPHQRESGRLFFVFFYQAVQTNAFIKFNGRRSEAIRL